MEPELPELPEEEPPERKRQKSKHSKQEDPDAEYLKTLVEYEQHAIDQFDKTVLTLAGGAFAVSFAFLKEVVKAESVTHRPYLVAAWACWAAALFCTLTSFYASHLSMREAQRQFQAGMRDEKLLGGMWGQCTTFLNPVAGLLFIVGLIFMSVFVTTNLNEPEKRRPSEASSNAPPSFATNATRARPATGASGTETNSTAKGAPL